MPYQYEPLPSEEHIRILTLVPGQRSDTIAVDLRTYDLNHAPPYEALSYTWGNPAGEWRMLVSNAALKVTRNLYLALLALRHDIEPRTLWIDAICINQRDDEEKGQQVSIMRDIYSKSHKTVIWLGEASDDSDSAISMCERLYQGYGTIHNAFQGGENKEMASWSPAQKWFYQAIAQGIIRDQLAAADRKVEPPTVDELSALKLLVRRSWFERIWCVQECVCANTVLVQCGTTMIDFDHLLVGLSHAARIQPAIWAGPRKAYNVTRVASLRRTFHSADTKQSDSQGQDILELLRIFRQYEATDPRDKIYALLGVCSTDLDSSGLCPDYTAGAVDVFTQFAFYLIENTSRLDIFHITRGSTPTVEGLLSWVPDWSDTKEQPYWLLGDYLGNDSTTADYIVRRFNTTRGSKVESVELIDESILSLNGFEIDTIEVVGDVYTFDETNVDIGAILRSDALDSPKKLIAAAKRILTIFDCLDVLKQWEEIARLDDLINPYKTGEDNRTVYQKTIWTALEPRGPSTAQQNFTDWMATMRGFRVAKSEFPSLDIDEDLSTEQYERIVRERLTAVVELIQQFSKIKKPQQQVHMLRRRLARTRRGFLALVPAGTDVDDLVLLLQGGVTPYIARSQDVAFQLVGDAYVHGIMQGELWNEHACQKMLFV